MRERLQSSAPWIAALIIFGAIGVLYYSYRVQIHTFDAISYTWNIEEKPLRLLFHPHHLLYGPVGWLAYQAARAVGYGGYADAPVQAVNAVAGAVGLFFFWRFGTRWSGRTWAVLGVATVIGVCHAYWLYAAEVEVYTLAAAFIMLALWAMALLDDDPHPKWAALLGAANAGAIMFHQTNALFAVPVILFLLANPRTRTAPIFLTYAAVGGFLTLAPYAAVGALLEQTPQQFIDWFMGYAQTGQWGGYLSWDHRYALLDGLQRTISTQGRWAVLFYAATLIGMGAAVWQARDDAAQRAWVAFGLAWIIPYALFFWWWEPWNIEFWIVLLPAWGLFILAIWRWEALPEPAAVLYLVFAVVLLQTHLPDMRYLSDRTNDYYFRMVQAVNPRSGDLVITRGNILDIYFPFYDGHEVLYSLRGVPEPARLDALSERIRQAHRTGQVVMIDAYVLNGEQRGDFSITPEEAEQLQAAYDWQPAGTLDGFVVFYQTPRYNDPTATQWSFDGSLRGWSVFGANEPRFDDGGWCLAGGVDPQLKNPRLTLDAEQYTTLQIDMMAGQDTVAEFFWGEQRVQIDIEEGRMGYTVELGDQPEWAGEITHLRLDPIPDESGINACVYSIELLP